MKLHKCHGLNEEKLDNSNTVMKTRPKKIFVPLGLIKVESKASTHLATKLLKIMAIPHLSGVVRKKPVLQAVSRITNGFS